MDRSSSFRHFVFDACGNTSKIMDNPPDYYSYGKQYPPNVISEAEWKATSQSRPMSYTMGSIPPAVEVCPRCLEGWDILNVATYKAVRDRKTDTWVHYHKNCHDLKIAQNEIKFFDEILEESGIKFSERRLIPAEYPDRPTAPWFMVETEKGPVKIGYRRRVISISWKHAEGLKDVDGNVLFEDQGVTKDRALIHAWGKEKAVEYLKKLLA